MADELGYDEETWPALKEALDRERERIGARKLFPDCEAFVPRVVLGG